MLHLQPLRRPRGARGCRHRQRKSDDFAKARTRNFDCSDNPRSLDRPSRSGQKNGAGLRSSYWTIAAQPSEFVALRDSLLSRWKAGDGRGLHGRSRQYFGPIERQADFHRRNRRRHASLVSVLWRVSRLASVSLPLARTRRVSAGSRGMAERSHIMNSRTRSTRGISIQESISGSSSILHRVEF